MTELMPAPGKRTIDPRTLVVHFGDVRPIIVCLCGSTRFSDAFRQANLDQTLLGKVVLTIGCDMRADADLFAGMQEEQVAAIKADLDRLHLRKIDIADEILVLNVGGYVGESTSREIAYAQRTGKSVRYLEPVKETANA
ncbi:hypothetical protein [Microbispora sp. NPDC049125]|uniref:hypothetical protein n=1 Tax=Microbispora sp. NPDC049125 TaxID=3154929 RepID=UPI003465715F